MRRIPDIHCVSLDGAVAMLGAVLMLVAILAQEFILGYTLWNETSPRLKSSRVGICIDKVT